MRRWLLAATAVYLAACSGPNEDSSGPKAGDPGSYTRNLPDGTPVTLVIREDGSVLRTAGKQMAVGTARTEDDRLCFVFADNLDAEYCWTNGPIRPGGTFESTSDEGETLIITYTSEVPPRGVEMTPGSYDIGSEESVFGRTEIKPDGTYIDYSEGKPVGEGRWSIAGERACFDPEGDENHQKERCWINGPADESGRFLTTREDGSQAYYAAPTNDQ